MPFQKALARSKAQKPHPGFELKLLFSFTWTITVTLIAPSENIIKPRFVCFGQLVGWKVLWHINSFWVV